MDKHKKPAAVRRGLLVTLCITLSVLLVLLIVLTIYIETMLDKINYVDPNQTYNGMSESEYNQMILQEETTDPEFTGPEIDPEDVIWGSDTEIFHSENVINFLLIGQDRREGEGRTRSDSMILCTINKAQKTLTMTSFMRDLYVQIPGYMDNRINASYAFGGMNLLNECLDKNFGVKIHGNIEIDCIGFQRAIDILGGVQIELTSAEASYLNRRGNWDFEDNAGQWSLKEGMNNLNGSQAVAFSRIRDVGNGDFGRTNRQRVMLSTLLARAKTMNLSQLNQLLNEILPLITTDLTESEIMGYAMELLPLLSDLQISTQQIPAEGAYKMTMIRGMSVLLPDLEKNRQIIEDIIEDTEQ